MKQVSQNYKSGRIRLEDVHPPLLKPGGVLVRTAYSVISAGTEGMKVREGKLSYLGKARARPDQVKKVMQSVQQQGLTATYEKVMNKLDSLTPLGYSLSGVVVDTRGDSVDLVAGQRVACAGAGYANHAEINFVPKNLVVPVPEGVAMEHAAFTTVGAIAMQGFRQADMQLGETACVLGLGLLGQLLVQILRAAGMQVIGLDLVEERCESAVRCGAQAATTPADPGLPTLVKRLTGGIGVDCTFLAAGGSTNAPVELAAQLARDRGRIVDIGKTRLDLPWNDYYEKELDVRFSRSYGPGRYDPDYEEKGIDYPVGYVRWTERRNMSSFLQLVADGRVNIDPIIAAVYPLSEAERVYEAIAAGQAPGLGILFKHSDAHVPATRLPNYGASVTAFQRDGSDSPAVRPARAEKNRVGLGVIGAGNYASSMLLPHLEKNSDVDFTAVATATSLSAANAARRFGFGRTSTDYQDVMSADDVDAALIATRHGEHAQMVADALIAGKSVYVEKPLAIDLTGLELVRSTVIESHNDRLMVGFNRRFSAPIRRMKEALRDTAPLSLIYRVHAGQIEHGSWYLEVASHGSRFIGEAGHFFDVFAFLTGCRPKSVTAKSLRPQSATADFLDNIMAVVEYEDGSLAQLSYLTQGDAAVPKEYLEVFGGGRTLQLSNFEHLTLYESNARSTIKYRGRDKGQEQEMSRFVASVKSGSAMPISMQSLLDTTLLTLAAADSLRSGQTVYLADYWELGS